MREWQSLPEALKDSAPLLACPEPDCIREFTLQRGLDHHLRMAHGRVVAKTPQSEARRAYQRDYHKRESVRAYQREWRKKRRRADPEFRERERERAKRRNEEKPEDIRLYHKARAAALKVLVRRHRDEYRLLLEVARERLTEQEEATG